MEIEYPNVYVSFLCQEIINLNNLTVYEYATIGASLRYLSEERFQCYTKAFKSENEMKIHLSRNCCNGIIKDKRAWHRFDTMMFNKCFCNFYNPCIQSLISISNSIKKFGILPNYLVPNQKISNKMIQAHNIIQGYFNELEQIELEKFKQKHKR